MPADLPDLDDRTFEQILDELRLRIPRYTPEWTDFNDSDPGITLIELFAWLAETIGYRLNQAPERCLLTFLDVLGISPNRPDRPRTDLTFTVRQGETRPITVPARTVVASNVQTDEGPILFETERGVELMPLRLQSLQVAGRSPRIELHTIEERRVDDELVVAVGLLCLVPPDLVPRALRRVRLLQQVGLVAGEQVELPAHEIAETTATTEAHASSS